MLLSLVKDGTGIRPEPADRFPCASSPLGLRREGVIATGVERGCFSGTLDGVKTTPPYSGNPSASAYIGSCCDWRDASSSPGDAHGRNLIGGNRGGTGRVALRPKSTGESKGGGTASSGYATPRFEWYSSPRQLTYPGGIGEADEDPVGDGEDRYGCGGIGVSRPGDRLSPPVIPPDWRDPAVGGQWSPERAEGGWYRAGLGSSGNALMTGVAIKSMWRFSLYASLSLRFRRRQKHASRPRKTRPANAPRTPPAMAPAEVEPDFPSPPSPEAGTVVPLGDPAFDEIVATVRVMTPVDVEVDVLDAVPVVVGAGGARGSIVEFTTM